jgi:branched-chain amino acid transport system permease protein
MPSPGPLDRRRALPSLRSGRRPLRPVSAVLALGVLLAVVVPALAGPALIGRGPAEAQEASAGQESVSGVLTAPGGDPLPGAIVEVTDPTGSVVGSTAAAADGSWEVILPGPGAYRVLLDTDSLPLELRDAAAELALDVVLQAGQRRTLIFPIGVEEVLGRDLRSRALQAAFNGLKFGMIIAMTAIGLSLIFGTTGLINFAHGELVTLGAALAFLFNASGALGFRVHLLPAALLAILLVAAFSAGLDRAIWRPLRARKVGLFQMLVISIGLMLVIRHVIVILYGSRSRPYAQFALQQPLEIGLLRVAPRDLSVIAISLVVLVGVALFLERSRLGKAMRAVSDNRSLAAASGIDVERIVLFVWTVGGGLAATGGVLLGTVENVNWLMGFRLLLLMFAGMILGGLGSAYGALVGSLLVGMVTELSVLVLPSELKYLWALLVLIVVLLIRPQGILGVKERVG